LFGAWAQTFFEEIIRKRGDVFTLDENDAAELVQAMREMGKFRRQEPPTDLGPAEVALVKVLWLLAGQPDQRGLFEPRSLRRNSILNWVEVHFQQPFELNRMAADFGVSRGTLTRHVRKHFEQSPLQLIHHRRLEEAQTLLRIAELSIADIAQQLGYSHPRTLRDLFRERYGMAPTEWRRIHAHES
jgi:AraC-like DNA-binding protein